MNDRNLTNFEIFIDFFLFINLPRPLGVTRKFSQQFIYLFRNRIYPGHYVYKLLPGLPFSLPPWNKTE